MLDISGDILEQTIPLTSLCFVPLQVPLLSGIGSASSWPQRGAAPCLSPHTVPSGLGGGHLHPELDIMRRLTEARPQVLNHTGEGTAAQIYNVGWHSLPV